MKVIFYFSSTKTKQSDIIIDNFELTEIYHNNLQMATNSARLTIPFDTDIANNLKIYGDINIRAEIIEGSKKIFTGFLRKDFNFQKTQRNQPISLEIVSPSILLNNEVGEQKTFIKKPAAEIIQYLLTRAGLVYKPIHQLYSKTITLCVLEEKDKIHDVLQQLCFELGYAFDFDNNGFFIINPLFEIPPAGKITQEFNGSNILDNITVTKKEEECNNVEGKWKEIIYLENTLIFSDTQKGNNKDKCTIEIEPNSFIFGKEENYIKYDSTEGNILLVTEIIKQDIKKDTGITLTIENCGKQGLLKAKNTTNTKKYIKQFDVYGNAYIKKADNITKATRGNKTKEYEIRYLDNENDIKEFVKNISNYYSYADYAIKLKSKQNYPVGSFVKVSESGMGSLNARIIKKQTFLNAAYIYELEAVSEYTPAEVKSHSYRNSSKISGLQGTPGKDGSTKLLPSLETTGDYENQIGTFQGQLYRWTGEKWILLNAVMPLNPVAYYDMADVSTDADRTTVVDGSGNKQHGFLSDTFERIKDNIIGTTIAFNKGYLSRPKQNFIGVGKQWSHSRWIKMNEVQEQTSIHRPWHYGDYDYSWFGTKDGKVDQFLLVSIYKDSNVNLSVKIPKEKIFDNRWHHLVVMTDLQETYCKKILYLDCIKMGEVKKDNDFSNWVSNDSHCDMAKGKFNPPESTVGSLANLIFFNRLLTEREVLYLYLNPRYPVKNYTEADWMIDSDNPNNAIAIQTPKYLGTSNIAPDGKQVFITNGGKTGNNTANIGDWILMTSNADSYKKGWCYRWTGSEWLKLDPQSQYQKEYTACLKDHFEKCGDMYSSEPQMFGALFCQFLAFNNAFGNFLEVKKLKIDNDSSNPNDFELNINKDVGILAKNKGKKIFEVSPDGNATFSGEINCQGFQVLNRPAPAPQFLYSWNKGDNPFDIFQKITTLKEIRFLWDNKYFIDTPLTSGHSVDGIYGTTTIRYIKCEQWGGNDSINVRVTLYSNNGDIIEKISGAKSIQYNRYITNLDEDGYGSAKWWPSQQNATFNTYNPSQKVIIPNISFSKPPEQNVLYRDENGFIKIS